jgi:hypothetical protein
MDELGTMGAPNVLFAILVAALSINYLAPKNAKPPRLKARYRCDGFEIEPAEVKQFKPTRLTLKDSRDRRGI